MLKASRIVFLAAIIMIVSGVAAKAHAQTQKGFYTPFSDNCSTSLLSGSICSQTDVNKPIIKTPVQKPHNPTSASQTPFASLLNLNRGYAPDDAILDSDKIFNLVNQYRISLNLVPFEKDDSICELARVRSTEIPSEITAGTLHSGLYNRPLPYWVWENAKYGSNEEGTVAWWLASPIHHASIVGDYKYSCVNCSGSYCSELFTSFTPKSGNIAYNQ